MVPPDDLDGQNAPAQNTPPTVPPNIPASGGQVPPRQQTSAPSPDQADQLAVALKAALPGLDDAVIDFARKVFLKGWYDQNNRLDPHRLTALQKYVQIESLTETDDGFLLKMKNGRAINWIKTTGEDGKPSEYIRGIREGFDSADADAVIALSAVRGWQTVYVHGTDHEKDLLWLAAQKQGLKVANHDPSPQMIKEYEDWKNANQNGGPGVSPNGGATGPGVSLGGSSLAQQPDPSQSPPQQASSQFTPTIRDTLNTLTKNGALDKSSATQQPQTPPSPAKGSAGEDLSNFIKAFGEALGKLGDQGASPPPAAPKKAPPVTGQKTPPKAKAKPVTPPAPKKAAANPPVKKQLSLEEEVEPVFSVKNERSSAFREQSHYPAPKSKSTTSRRAKPAAQTRSPKAADKLDGVKQAAQKYAQQNLGTARPARTQGTTGRHATAKGRPSGAAIIARINEERKAAPPVPKK